MSNEGLRNWTTKEQVLFIIVFFLCVWILFPLVYPIMSGLILAYTCEEFVQKLRVKTKKTSRSWHWFFACSVLLIATVVIFVPLFLIIVDSAQKILNLVTSGTVAIPDISFMIDKFEHVFSVFAEPFGGGYLFAELPEKIHVFVSKMSSHLVAVAGAFLYDVPQLAIKSVIMLVTALIFIVDGKRYREKIIPKLIPWKHLENLISHSTSSVIKALVLANLGVSAIQSILMTLCFAAFSIPNFATLGVLGFFASFIPVFGTAPVILSVSAYCYFSGDRMFAAIFMIAFCIFIGLLDNFLRPLLMKNRSDLNFFWIFVGIFSGLYQCGVMGMFIAPVLFTIFYTCLKDLDSANAKLNLKEEES